MEDETEIPSLTIGYRAFQNCTKLADFAGAGANSIVIDGIGAVAFTGCASFTYDMLDKIKTVPGATKVQDAVNKKYIYFKPDSNANMPSKGCLIYGEIES
jgi:hypothetical protein